MFDALSASLARRPLALVVAGWGVSRLLLTPLSTATVGGWVPLPGFWVLIASIFLSLHLLSGASAGSRWALACAGASADGIPWWIVRPGTGAPYSVSGPFDGNVVLASVVSLALVLAVAWAASAIGRHRPGPSRPPSVLRGILAGGVALAVVVAYRVVGECLRELPNEERSLLIRGFEIHHAIFGALGVMVTSLLLASRAVANGPVLALLCGACAGAVLDQATYLQFAEATDAAYYGPASYAGAGVAVVCHATMAVWLQRRRRGSPG